jgi:CheY-like chemotaxis protein
MDKSKKILIIELDNKYTQELISLFSNEDYDLEISRSFTEAVEKIKNIKFDCAIMDVDLPEMKGYEAVPIIKMIDPKIQIIITANQNTLALEANVRKQDVFYYYIKSFDRQELKLAVRDVFNKLGKIKEDKKMDRPSHILIVDDDTNFVKGIRRILESKGYKVESAYNKSEAIEKIGGTKPDLILLDLMLEKLFDGFDICYQLKHDPEMKKIPILAISAITEKTGFKFSPETDGEYFEANDYIEKPVKANNLLERIKKLLKE